MKILWVKTDFLHPTTKGGQIRTLEMVRRLHRRHEVHYVAFADAEHPEGVSRAGEYCSRAYPLEHRVVSSRRSLAFAWEAARNLVSPLPLSIERYRSEAMRRKIDELLADGQFDSLVCDFLFPAPNIASMKNWVLFQHNVETIIWRRHAETAAKEGGLPLKKLYFGVQADRMFEYERHICRQAAHTVAVSDIDADRMRNLFGIDNVSAVPTGVDVESFTPPAPAPSRSRDLVFVGSMDWMPNIDGVQYFVRDILPRIRQRIPDCTLTVVGRKPTPDVKGLAAADPKIEITGTVDDVRKYLWEAKVSIVPLRIGGGTRLKIYEAMAAKAPVVSTTVGAEGLTYRDGRDLIIADTPEAFAEDCCRLLTRPAEREHLAQTGWEMVRSRFSWEHVTDSFEQILLEHRTHRRSSVMTAVPVPAGA